MPLWKINFVTMGQIKEAPTNAGANFAERIVRYVLCDFCHVGCLRTLLTLNDLELHLIAFGEGFETAA